MEQLVEASQTRAIADALLRLRRGLAGGGAWRGASLAQLLDALEREMDEQARADGGKVLCGPDARMPRSEPGRQRHACTHAHMRTYCVAHAHPTTPLSPVRPQGVDALAGRAKPGNLARPRRFELAAAINRLRTAQLRQL